MVMLLPLVFLAIGIGGTIFWIWMLIDCATKEPSEGNDKLIWVLIIVLTHWIGALIYLLARRPKRIEEFGK
ncbi:MAG: PLDc_N domain-containing protein [Kiritimatiellae bacterium]|nr:PLDc_N domain-containing protein [Kiritimatiellia bacterium]